MPVDNERPLPFATQQRWQDVVDDTTAALAIDANYVKVLARRAQVTANMRESRRSNHAHTLACTCMCTTFGARDCITLWAL
jgi:hypothetical protein